MTKYDEVYDSCPVCSSKHIFHYHSDYRENKIYRCSKCTLQFMNPVYSDEYLHDYYSNYIPQELDQRLLDHQSQVIDDNFKAINAEINNGRLLDFGTGDGTHAKYANENNWYTVAYDVDCKAMAKVRKEFDIETYCGNFFEIDWGTEKFDLIYANQVMEHLKNPVRYLQHFYNLLNDGAHLFISVPNINTTSSRMKRFLERKNLRTKNIGKYYDSDHHVMYYTPASMKNLLELCGFRVTAYRNCAKTNVGKSKIQQLADKLINEKLLSTSTFLLVAKKITSTD